MSNERDLAQQFERELDALARREEGVELVTRPAHAWIMLSAIQYTWRKEG